MSCRAAAVNQALRDGGLTPGLRSAICARQPFATPSLRSALAHAAECANSDSAHFLHRTHDRA
jgi:hypothetical protein